VNTLLKDRRDRPLVYSLQTTGHGDRSSRRSPRVVTT